VETFFLRNLIVQTEVRWSEHREGAQRDGWRWRDGRSSALATLAVQQEVAHVEVEGAADVVAAVVQRARQTAAVERAEGVGAAAAEKKKDAV